MRIAWTDLALDRVEGAYRVFYRVDDAVVILTVRHGSQLIREVEVAEGQI